MKNIYSHADEFFHDFFSEFFDLDSTSAEPHGEAKEDATKVNQSTKSTIKEQMENYYTNKSKEEKTNYSNINASKRRSSSQDLKTNSVAVHKKAKEDYLATAAANLNVKNSNTTYKTPSTTQNSTNTNAATNPRSVYEELQKTSSSKISNLYPNEVNSPWVEDSIAFGYDLDEGDISVTNSNMCNFTDHTVDKVITLDTTNDGFRVYLTEFLINRLFETSKVLMKAGSFDSVNTMIETLVTDKLLNGIIDYMEDYFKAYSSLVGLLGEENALKLLGNDSAVDILSKNIKKYFE